MENVKRDVEHLSDITAAMSDGSERSEAGADAHVVAEQGLGSCSERQPREASFLGLLHISDSYIVPLLTLHEAAAAPSCRAREADSTALLLGGDLTSPLSRFASTNRQVLYGLLTCQVTLEILNRLQGKPPRPARRVLAPSELTHPVKSPAHHQPPRRIDN